MLDHGAANIRAGWLPPASAITRAEPQVVMPNLLGRVKRQQRLLVGDEITEQVKDFASISQIRPCERGFITDAFVQQTIWDRLFSPQMMNVMPSGVILALTTPPFIPAEFRRVLHELVFETYGFVAMSHPLAGMCAAHAFRARDTPLLSSAAASMDALRGQLSAVMSEGASGLSMCGNGTGVVADVGFSGTHIVPVCNYKPLAYAIRRVDVGGKVLTNYLKELVSYRQWNMMDNTPLIDEVKERLCYVSQSYARDVQLAKQLSTPAVLRRYTAMAAAAPRVVLMDDVAAAAAPYSSPASCARIAPEDDGVGVGFRREYALPDFVRIMKGYVRGSDADPARAAAAAVLPDTTGDAPANAAADARMRMREGVAAAAAQEGGSAPAGKAGDKRPRDAMTEDAPANNSATAAAPSRGGKSSAKQGAGKARKKRGDDDSHSDDDSEHASDHDDDDMDSDSDDSDDDEDAVSGGARSARAASQGVSALMRADGGPILPRAGSAGDDDEIQTLVMNSERFAAPELLFHPSDVGFRQAGIHAAIAEAIQASPTVIQHALWASIVLVGGSARLPGLEARLGRELRSLAPPDATLQLYTPDRPDLTAWRGMAAWIRDTPDWLRTCTITRRLYAEEGERACDRLFDGMNIG